MKILHGSLIVDGHTPKGSTNTPKYSKQTVTQHYIFLFCDHPHNNTQNFCAKFDEKILKGFKK